MPNEKKKLLFIMGTRPEVIKMAPLITLARSMSDSFEVLVVTTSQHRQMLDQMLDTFKIKVDIDLNIMRHDQNLSQVTTAAIEGLNPVVRDFSPDFVIVQGDTTSTFTGALCAFYNQIPVAHIEAGLRTYDKKQPFPEEINRRLTSQIADYHFAPTERSRSNLTAEGVCEKNIWVTGNTCIDSLFLTLKNNGLEESSNPKNKTVLITAHRRENHGDPLVRICKAIVRLAKKYQDVKFVYPLHMSPRVRNTAEDILKGFNNIQLIEPVEYESFVKLMNSAYLILTDSGGIQEEAPALHKPVLVMRDTTERPEGVEAGTLKLVGTEEERIVNEVTTLLEDEAEYQKMANCSNPYGVGNASEQILDVLLKC